MLLAAMLLPSTVCAGTLTVAVAPGDVVTIETAVLEGADLGLQPAGPGRYSFTVPPGKLTSPLVVKVGVAPDDYANAPLIINVPFFWNSGDPQPVVAGLAPRRISSDDRFWILRNGGRLISGPLSDQILLNQMTRRAFTQFLGEPLPTGPDDIKIISFFLITSKELVLTRFVEPDDDMQRAASFLADKLRVRADLFESDAARENVSKAIADFKTARRTQLQSVIYKLANRVGPPASSPRSADACERMQAASATLKDLVEEDAGIDPDRAMSIQASTALTVCLAPALKQDAAVTEAVRADALVEAAKVVDRIGADLPVYVDAAGEDTRARNARNGSIALRDLIDFQMFR